MYSHQNIMNFCGKIKLFVNYCQKLRSIEFLRLRGKHLKKIVNDKMKDTYFWKVII